MYTFCLNYRTKGLHLFPSFWGKSCASQYSIFFLFFRLAHLLLNFLVKRCAPFGQNIKQKVYTLWSKKCTPFASIFYRKVYTFCPIMLSFTTSALYWVEDGEDQQDMTALWPSWSRKAPRLLTNPSDSARRSYSSGWNKVEKYHQIFIKSW